MNGISNILIEIKPINKRPQTLIVITAGEDIIWTRIFWNMYNKTTDNWVTTAGTRDADLIDNKLVMAILDATVEDVKQRRRDSK